MTLAEHLTELRNRLIISISAFVAAAIYLTDVRPKVRGSQGGGTNSGPYGPW